LGLAYASYWIWLEVPKLIRGTFISSFGIFAAVIAIFAMLSLAQLIFSLLERLVGKHSASSVDVDAGS